MGMSRLRNTTVVMFILLAAVAAVPRPADAAPVTVKIGVAAADAVTAGYGDLQQIDLTGCGDLPDFGCGPTAAVNSFVFLQNTRPDIYGKKLVPELDRTKPENDLNKDGKVDRYDDMIAAGNALAGDDYMQTCCNRTTLRDDFYSGKRKYIEERTPNVTDYGVMDDPVLDRLDPNGTFPDDTPDLQRSPPSWDFLAEALEQGQDVELLITRDDGTKLIFGHYVTLTGLEFVDTDMDGGFDDGESATIHFMDPNGGPKSRVLRRRADGRLFLVSTDGKIEFDIRMAVEESPRFKKTDPIPAPPSAALLALAVAGIALRSRTRRAAAAR